MWHGLKVQKFSDRGLVGFSIKWSVLDRPIERPSQRENKSLADKKEKEEEKPK
jgi:hypothetical protein